MAALEEIELQFPDVHAAETGADSMIWEEDPVTFREFCESGAFLDAFSLSDRQYQDAELLIGNDPKKMFDPSRENSILVMVYGKGGGKDEVASRISLYVVYVLLCMRSPQEYLIGVKSASTLHIINVAKKGRQAQEIFFTYFRNWLLRSRWFRDRFDIAYKGQWHSKVKRRNKVRGKVVVTQDEAKFPKNIHCLAETTENESWEGYNPVLFNLDEISGFTSAKELEQGWAIFNTARTSVTSRQTKTFKGMGLVFSYPRQEEGDIILDLYKLSQTPEGAGVVASLAYPWQSKGMHIYSGETFVFRHPRLDTFFGIDNVGIEVPVEYREDFVQRPEDSMTKYLCIPPKTSGAWIEYPDHVYSHISSTDPNSPSFRPRLFRTEDYIDHVQTPDGKVTKYLCKRIIGCAAKTQYERFSVRRVMWLDNAEMYCDAVVVIAHYEQRTIKLFSGEVVSVNVVVIDDELVWRPDPKFGVQVSVSNIESIMVDTIPGYVKVVAAGADQWNSAELLERFRRKGIIAEKHNINLDDYDLLKRQTYIGGMDFLAETIGPAQLVNLVRTGSAKQKPIKKPLHLQDSADSHVGVVKMLVGQEPNRRASRGLMQDNNRVVGVTGGMVVPSAPFSNVAATPSGPSPTPPAPGNASSPVPRMASPDLIRQITKGTSVQEGGGGGTALPSGVRL